MIQTSPTTEILQKEIFKNLTIIAKIVKPILYSSKLAQYELQT